MEMRGQSGLIPRWVKAPVWISLLMLSGSHSLVTQFVWEVTEQEAREETWSSLTYFSFLLL